MSGVFLLLLSKTPARRATQDTASYTAYGNSKKQFPQELARADIALLLYIILYILFLYKVSAVYLRQKHSGHTTKTQRASRYKI